MQIINTELFLISYTEKKKCPAKIQLWQGDDGDFIRIKITVTFDGTDYSGIGKDYLWVDAFADLQRNLPSNVKLACCMTCRHGNMCPFGTAPRELFCTKDITIFCKDDMIKLFDTGEKFEEALDKRVVLSDAFCNDFEYQNTDCYIYNVFLFHLEL